MHLDGRFGSPHRPDSTDEAVSATTPPESEELLESGRRGREELTAHSSVAAATRDEWGTDFPNLRSAGAWLDR